MARHLYGGQGAEYVVDPTSFRPRPDLDTTFWSAPVGGTRYTDLLDPSGAAVTSLKSVVGGGFGGQFSGPDGVTQMWADAGGSSRTLFVADDLAGGLGAVSSVNGQTGAVVVGNGTTATDNNDGTFALTLSGTALNVSGYNKSKLDQLLSAKLSAAAAAALYLPASSGTISVIWNAATSRWETLAGTAITTRSDISPRSDVMVRWCGGTTATPPPGMTATSVNPSFPNDTWTRADGSVVAGWQGAPASDAFTAKLQTYNPALLLKLDETAGTVAVDASANARNGVYAGTYTLGQTNSELAYGSGVQLRISPTIGKVTVPHDVALNLGTTSAERWTVAYFTHWDNASPSFQNAVGKGDESSTTAGSRGFAFWHGPTSSGQFKCGGTQYGPDAVAYGSEVLSSWYWIVWTFDGTNVRFYRDGVLRYTSGTVTALTCDTTVPLTVGTSSTGTSANGAFDEVAIIKSTLTDAQIAELAGMLTITPPVSGGGTGQPFSVPGTPIASTTWTSVWSDEFDTDSTNGGKWQRLTNILPNGKGDTSQVSVSNSQLHLWSISNGTTGWHGATIGYVTSSPADGASAGHLFAVGEYAEARVFCRGPNSSTAYNWDAWWGDSTSGVEGDWFEMLTNGAGAKSAHVVYHPDFNTQASNTEITGNWFNSWHIIGCHRVSADLWRVYYDGVLVKSLDTSANANKSQSQALLLNSGSGSNYGSAGSFDVDWVRVWS